MWHNSSLEEKSVGQHVSWLLIAKEYRSPAGHYCNCSLSMSASPFSSMILSILCFCQSVSVISPTARQANVWSEL